MKKLLSILCITAVIAVVMTSCGNNQEKVAAEAARQLQRYKDSLKLAADTAGLAEFRAWKAQNELMNDPEYVEGEYAPAAAAPGRSTALLFCLKKAFFFW
jgi:hypothetical protein